MNKCDVLIEERKVGMKSLRGLLTLMAVLLAGVWLAAEPVGAATISVDTVQAQPGNSLVMAVRLSGNSIGIAGLSIPLRYASTHLTLDSVSFVGTLLPSDFTGSELVDQSAGTVHILYIPPFADPIPTISATSGVICRLYFRLGAGAQAGLIPIDSINFDSTVYIIDTNGQHEIHLQDKVVLSDGLGVAHLPSFTAGYVRVNVTTAVGDEDGPLPTTFELGQNYPNPFNPTTVISYSLPRASHVTLEVFNVLGQRVSLLVDQQVAAGNHEAVFDASQQTSGIYFYRLSHDGGQSTRKMILVK